MTFDPDQDGKCRSDKTESWHICNAEQADFEAWRAKHSKVCPLNPPEPSPSDPLGIGGFGAMSSYSLKMTQTMMGLDVHAMCACGASEDVTHGEHW